MSFLTKNEFLPYAPDGIDEQIKINHANCPAGEDTKQRLYIKRIENNGILAYCHHCGKRGVAFSNATPTNYASSNSNRAKQAKHGAHSRACKMPYDATTDTSKWHPAARAWIRKYGITDKEISEHGIFYSNYKGRVGLPTWDKSGIAHISYRKIHKTDLGPKYLTEGCSSAAIISSQRLAGSLSPTTIIIVEDLLSAIKCARVCNAVALNGVHLSDKLLSNIVKEYNKIVIFLDDDCRQVKLNEIAIKNRIEQFGKDVTIVHSIKQPKELTEDEIRIYCS